MIKNSYLEKFNRKRKNISEFEKKILSEDDNYVMNLQRPISVKQIKKFSNDKLQIFIDDIMCNKNVNYLLFSKNGKKELNLYLRQKNAIIKNARISDKSTYSPNQKKLTHCQSLFWEKKKALAFDSIKKDISNFKLAKSLSMNKLKSKNDEFFKSQKNINKLNSKLFFRSVNEIRFKGYQRSFKTCLEKSKSNSEFNLPEVDLKIDDVYSRLYHNMILTPIKIGKKMNKNNKLKNKKIKPLINLDNLNNMRNENIPRRRSVFTLPVEERVVKHKFKLRNLFREYIGKEFLIVSSFSNRQKCWRKSSGGPTVKELYMGKLNLNKFKRNKLKEKNYFSSENSKEDDTIMDVNDYRDKDLNSNLHLAVKNNNVEFVQYFLNKNYNPNEKNKLGDTPLHYAIEQKNKQIIKLLIDNKGDLDIKNNNGISPYDLADKELRNYFKFGNMYK